MNTSISLLTLLAALVALDGVNTMYLLSTGAAVEFNPVWCYIIQHCGPGALLVIKTLISPIVIILTAVRVHFKKVPPWIPNYVLIPPVGFLYPIILLQTVSSLAEIHRTTQLFPF
jgi:hypothetical protein